jgi:hypothetical protein
VVNSFFFETTNIFNHRVHREKTKLIIHKEVIEALRCTEQKSNKIKQNQILSFTARALPL